MDTQTKTIISIVSAILLVFAAVRDWNKTVKDAGSSTFKELQSLYDTVKREYDAVRKELAEESGKRKELERVVEKLQQEVQALKIAAQQLKDEITKAADDLGIARTRILQLEKELERKQMVLDELLKKIGSKS